MHCFQIFASHIIKRIRNSEVAFHDVETLWKMAIAHYVNLMYYSSAKKNFSFSDLDAFLIKRDELQIRVKFLNRNIMHYQYTTQRHAVYDRDIEHTISF